MLNVASDLGEAAAVCSHGSLIKTLNSVATMLSYRCRRRRHVAASQMKQRNSGLRIPPSSIRGQSCLPARRRRGLPLRSRVRPSSLGGHPISCAGTGDRPPDGRWAQRRVKMWLTTAHKEAAVVGSVAEPGLEIAPVKPPPTRGPGPRFGGRLRAFLAKRRPRSTAAVRPAEAHRRAELALAVLQRSQVVLQRG